MTALSCPACGLQQTLVAPRCARCGAPLDGSAPVHLPVPPAAGVGPAGSPSAGSPVVRDAVGSPAHPTGATPADSASLPDERTMLRDALQAPPGSAAVPPWATPGAVPSEPQQSFWSRLWRRIIGEPERPPEPPAGAPRE